MPLPAPGAGAGLKTGARPRGSGVIVVDLDGYEAQETWQRMSEEAGEATPDTYAVATGREGGLQLYFEHPGFIVQNSVKKLSPNIDIRGDGGYAVVAGSPHWTGGVYMCVNDVPPAPAPRWLLTWFRTLPSRPEVQPHPEDVQGAERARRRELYGSWLASEAPICVDGQGGDETLFKVVQRGAYDLALPTEDVLELIEEHYDLRCSPPWGDALEERVLHKARDAKHNSLRPRNAPLLEEEASGLAELIERTTLVRPKAEKGPDDTFGFKLKRGGWNLRPESPNYLVEHVLVEGKVSMIFAEPGTIKSWTAIDIAACVAEGVPWLGERATTAGPALYVDYEDGEHEFHRRVHLLTGGEERRDLIYTYAPGSINDKEWWGRLEKLVGAYGVRFVVIDTLAGATPGVDENDRNAADPLVYAGWFTETAKVTVLVLHHANRAGDIRGTSAFKANVDTLFKLETLADENGTHKAKLTCIKSGHKKVYPIYLELTDEGLAKFEPEDDSAGGGEDQDKEEKRTLDELQHEVLLLIESEGPFASIEKIRERLKARKSNIVAVLAELAAVGDAFKSPEGWRRDGEALRQARLRRAIEQHPEAVRGKLLSLAYVSKEFFDRCRQEGRVRPAIVGDEASGFVWVEL